MEIARKIIKNLLLVFVLVSIGYAFGKHSVKKTEAPDIRSGDSQESVDTASYIQVYYMHASFRCSTCNQIKRMTKELLATKFEKEMESGLIRFTEVDFQEKEALAKKFDIIASCVVVANVEGVTITDFKRLDKVWTLLKDSKKFNDYISDAILAYLPGENENQGGAQ